MLGKSLKSFNGRFVDTFDEYCNLGLFMLKYHSFHHMKEDVRKFGMLSVFTAFYMTILMCT